MATAFDLTQTYVHLQDGSSAHTVDVHPAFWSEISSRTDLHVGRLMTAFNCSGDPGHWESHPAGEELLLCLSGEIRVIMEMESSDGAPEERNVWLRKGMAVLVPK